MPVIKPVLRLDRVCKSYAANGNAPVHILRETSLEIGQGESVAIIGPSGSGKSTLLNLIGALDRPDSGAVFLEEQDLSTLNEKELAEVRHRQVGFIFQSHHLLPHCTVLENVLVPVLARASQVSRDFADRAEKLLKRVGLFDRMTHRPGQLSGGERQRVAVVRALINNPKLLLADEPTGSLDRNSAAELAELLGEINREDRVTLVTVTHSLELAGQMNRILELRDGQLKPWQTAA